MSDPTRQTQLDLTVGLVIGAERTRASKCLRHLLAQTIIDRIEIVCVDLCPNAGDVPEVDEPRVRHIPEPSYPYIETGMARCITEARAPLIAVIEDHCYAEPAWADHVVRAFEGPDVAMVNYSFKQGASGNYLDRSFLVTEYGRWMAPTRARPVPIAACNNIAYRIEALSPYTESLEEHIAMAPTMHTQIQESGGIVWQEPGAIVAHEGWSNLWSGCWANGIMKRMYGGYRALNGGWGLPRRLLYAGAMTLAPALHLLRLGWSMRDRPRLWVALVSSLPVAVVVYAYSSYQEALGYLFGPGRSREDFTDMELSVSRQG